MAKEEEGIGKEGQVDLAKLTEALEGLPEGVQTAVKTAIQEATNERDAAIVAAKANQEDDDDDNDDDDEFDIERSSRTDLVNHINKGFTKALTKALKPIQERLEATSTDAETDRVKREFGAAKDKYSDFMEWKDEMREIITKHPELAAEDIYLLARSKNPKKVKEIEEKTQEEKKKKDEEEGNVVTASFGGLLPTSGKSASRDTKRKPKEAASAAWDEVMGSIPDDLLGQALEG